jgi:hypothetical protein
MREHTFTVKPGKKGSHVRPTRAALTLVATALTPALLLATPAFAAAPATTVATSLTTTGVDDTS